MAKITVRIFCLLCFFFGLHNKASAEILEVVITWLHPVECQESCVKGLEKRFMAIPAVQNVEINQAAGVAVLKWKPNASFSYTPINYALRWIGLREQSTRIKVRGKVSLGKNPYDPRKVTYNIISDKDKTSFNLLSSVTSDSNDYVVQFNRQNRELSASVIEQLKEAQKKKQTLIISGTLFMPLRSPPDPLSIIIDQIQVEEKKEEKKK